MLIDLSIYFCLYIAAGALLFIWQKDFHDAFPADSKFERVQHIVITILFWPVVLILMFI